MARIFISHSSLDGEQAARLLTWLRGVGFVSTFLDFDKHQGFAPGADWERTLYREVTGADAVILILTKNWFSSKWCFVEFAQARALGKAIFPLIEAPTAETFVSADIQHLNLVKDREGGLARLQLELTRIALNTRGGYPWEQTRPPYPGLLAFDEADAAIYFGRDDDVRRLIERLNARRAQGGEKLVVVLGASGSGKSSLLRAGLVPRLKRDPHNWIVLPPFRPQLHPLDELAQVIATALGPGAGWRQWRAAFEADDLHHALVDLAHDLRAIHQQNEAQVLLVIDQGEELFAGADPQQTEQFFDVLNTLLGERLPFLTVMSLRSDYLGDVQQEPQLRVPFEQFSLKPMPLERVREIIEGPARVAGVLVDEALVTTAIADARTADALPLLAFTLRELYDNAASSGRLTVEAYRELGEAGAQLSPLENAVRRKADEVLAAAKPTPEDLQALKVAFIPAMVCVNAEGEYVRRPTAIAALSPRALPLIERLAKARLLTIVGQQGAATVEVAHEALLRKWPRLRGWLDEEREFLIGKQQLEHDLLDWLHASPDEKTDALLSGLKLTRARTWLLTKPHQLSDCERTFIQASLVRQEAVAAEKEGSRRRALHGSIAAAAVLAVVAVGALWEWRRAKIQENQAVSRQFAAQAIVDSTRDVGLAFREAVEAGERSETAEAEFALSTVLGKFPEDFVFHHHGRIRAAYSSDGSRIVTASDDGTARVWDSRNGSLIIELSGDKKPTGDPRSLLDAASSRDGKRVVTASEDLARIWNIQNGQLLATVIGSYPVLAPDGERIFTDTENKPHIWQVWNANDGRPLATLAGGSGLLIMATFSADDRYVFTRAIYTNTEAYQVWDSRSGHLQATLSGHDLRINRAAFSPDDKRIVTLSDDNLAGLWNAETGRQMVTLTGHTGYIYGVGFSSDGKRVVTASFDRTARVWDTETGHILSTVPCGTRSGGFELDPTFSPDGKHILTASDSGDNTVKVWDAANGHLVATLSGHRLTINSARFSSDGKHILTAGDDGTARVWDAEEGTGPITRLGDNIIAAAISPDGNRVLTLDTDGTIRTFDINGNALAASSSGAGEKSAQITASAKRIVTSDLYREVWDANTGRLLNRYESDSVFSPDATRVLTLTEDNIGQVRDTESGRLIATLAGHMCPRPFFNAKFSPDNLLIVATICNQEDKTIQPLRVWDANDGRLLTMLTPHKGRLFVHEEPFSPDGKRIVTGSFDGKYSEVIWDSRSGHQLASMFPYSKNFWLGDAAFSPNGKLIATSTDNGTELVWNAHNGQLVSSLLVRGGRVSSARFSPSSKRILTVPEDESIEVWDVDNGFLVNTLPTIGKNTVARFSPDGKRIITVDDEGTARIYIVGFDELLKRARQHLPIDSGK
ncbi:MAG TPA: TIR domain-containing protein [Terriglobales bacterium]